MKKLIIYDGAGRVIRQEFADGGFNTYEYFLSGNVVTSAKMTDTLGRVMVKRFNAAGYVIGTTDEIGQTKVIQREMLTNLKKDVTGPCGCPIVKRTFDAQGNTTSQTDRLGQRSEFNFNPTYNFVTQTKDALGRITRITYDSKGNRTSITDALGRITNYSYDGNGQLVSITDPLNHTTQFSYNANGYINRSTDALNNITSFEYDAVGRLKKSTDAEGRSATIDYDASDRVTMVTDAAGIVTKYEYDENNNRTGIINANNKKWTLTYDPKNRLQRSTDPLSQTTQYRYNADDETTAMLSPTGRVVRYEYDSRGQRAKIIDPLQGEIRFAYDNRKNLTTLTDQRGNTTTFVYDELYRLIGQRDPLGRSTSFSYDALGNQIGKNDRLNRPTRIDYDALNRPATITYVDATVGYNFDEAGRLTKITDTNSGAIDWTYDNANRMLSEKTPQGTVSYAYNKANQRATMTAADRPVVNYGYDPAGRLSTIKQSAETFTWAYDELSRMKSLSRPNNITTNYEYDAANKLSRILHANAVSGFALEDLKYTYNPDNEIEAIASLASGTLLPTAKTAAGADPANRVSRFGQAGYTFDEEGQTRTKTDNQGTAIYDWDARGRLVKATLPNGQVVTYGYDATGRRSSRTAGGLATSFLYDGRDVVLDRNSGNLYTEYLDGPRIDGKLRQLNQDGQRFFFLQDQLQSISKIVNGDGQVVKSILYEPYGGGGGNNLTRYSYSGREEDYVTSLTYYRARWYDSYSSRFFSEDPKMFLAGSSMFNYVDGNPISYRDPLGTDRSGDDPYFTKWEVYDCNAAFTDPQNSPSFSNPIPHSYSCVSRNGVMTCKGLVPANYGFGGEVFNETFTPNVCKKIKSNGCLAQCMLDRWQKDEPNPPSWLGSGFCTGYNVSVQSNCYKKCGLNPLFD